MKLVEASADVKARQCATHNDRPRYDSSIAPFSASG